MTGNALQIFADGSGYLSSAKLAISPSVTDSTDYFVEVDATWTSGSSWVSVATIYKTQHVYGGILLGVGGLQSVTFDNLFLVVYEPVYIGQ